MRKHGLGQKERKGDWAYSNDSHGPMRDDGIHHREHAWG